MTRIAFVSRELHPLGGGGIGVQVAGACAALAGHAEVTVITSSKLEEAHRRREAEGLPSAPDGVRLAFVDEPEPDEVGTYYGAPHLYSARVWERLSEVYPGEGPDLIEFSDFMAEGLVTVQARRGYASTLRRTGVCVRLHTSAEMCSVLDGHIGDDFYTRMVVAAERHALRHADRLISPSASVLDTYTRFYAQGGPRPGDGGAGAELAPAATIRPVVPSDPSPIAPPPGLDAVRFLYVGRLERRKGVQDLIRAFTRLRRENWTLELVGGDTSTAPLGTSMRDTLELAAAGHPSITFHGALPREAVRKLMDESHVLLAPSRWECWPSVVLEALGRNRPVLTTPTGGMPEMLAAHRCGWLMNGADEDALATSVESLLEAPELISESIDSEAPRRAYRELNDPAPLRNGYLALAGSVPRLGTRRELLRRAQELGAASTGELTASEELPLVSVVVPYFELERFVEETLRSVYEQDYPAIEAILVNDGSLRREDAVVEEMAARFPIRVLTQENGGLSRARDAGIAQSSGRYVLPLDADNALHPTFVSRCVEILEEEPDVGFVTTWSQYVAEDGSLQTGLDSGFQPIGNSTSAVMVDNVAGDGTAVIRRSIFDRGYRYATNLTSYEDWQLYRELHRDGHFGVVIPERLLVYRLRPDSMVREVGLVNHGWIYGEMQAGLREKEVEWVSTSAAT